MATLRTQWASLSFEKKLTIVGAPLLIAVLTGLVLSPLSSLLTDRKVTQLEVVDLKPLDAPVNSFEEPYIPPTVDVLVRNTGDQVSVIHEASLEILDYGLLKICEAGGALEVSASYDAILPTGPAAIHRTVTVSLSQGIKEGEADRFSFKLSVPESQVGDGAHVYRIRLLLRHDDKRNPVDAGTFIISVPVAVDEWYLDEKSIALGGGLGACYAQNAAIYARFASLSGERSSGMATPIPR